MANKIGWGKAHINNVGYGGAHSTNTIGFGSIGDKSHTGETLLSGYTAEVLSFLSRVRDRGGIIESPECLT